MNQAVLSSFIDELEKIAALGADLRMKGIGGVQRPPEPTEMSKNFSFKQLKDSQNVGTFKNTVKPQNLVKPGPTIQQIAPTPQPV